MIKMYTQDLARTIPKKELIIGSAGSIIPAGSIILIKLLHVAKKPKNAYNAKMLIGTCKNAKMQKCKNAYRNFEIIFIKKCKFTSFTNSKTLWKCNK